MTLLTGFGLFITIGLATLAVPFLLLVLGAYFLVRFGVISWLPQEPPQPETRPTPPLTISTPPPSQLPAGPSRGLPAGPAQTVPPSQAPATAPPIEAGVPLSLFSPIFLDGEIIPPQYTCQGANVSPPLGWGAAPRGTRAFALLCEDPDASGGAWVHWVLYDIPRRKRSLPENLGRQPRTTDGTQGSNSFDRLGYDGPCPQPGDVPHRYVFTLYALDRPLKLRPGANKAQVMAAMRGHVIGRGQVTGRFGQS
ncbi:MAG: YbhB/YbcL family Raf kinase inhibitor-like protein [Anaerolineae bacterium]|nr:YbhB/YbcL family Raf kinase inhibitor-like protein [Anaerolineae bacterium]